MLNNKLYINRGIDKNRWKEEKMLSEKLSNSNNLKRLNKIKKILKYMLQNKLPRKKLQLNK